MQLGAQALGPGARGGLGSAIGAVAGEAAKTRHAGDASERAAPGATHGRRERGERCRHADHIDLQKRAQLGDVLDRFAERSRGNTRVRDDEIRWAEAADEVLRGGGQRRLVAYVDLIGDYGARDAGGRRPAGDEPEDRIGRSVVPGERLADARRGSGNDDSPRLYLFPFRTMSTSWDAVCSMPSREPPCSALTVYFPWTAIAGVPSMP